MLRPASQWMINLEADNLLTKEISFRLTLSVLLVFRKVGMDRFFDLLMILDGFMRKNLVKFSFRDCP